jgi:hypothetical protein
MSIRYANRFHLRNDSVSASAQLGVNLLLKSRLTEVDESRSFSSAFMTSGLSKWDSNDHAQVFV